VQSNAVIEVFASPVKEFIDTTLPEALVLLESSTPRLPHLFSLVHDWEEGLTSNLACFYDQQRSKDRYDEARLANIEADAKMSKQKPGKATITVYLPCAHSLSLSHEPP
jgi:hypothetical protein